MDQYRILPRFSKFRSYIWRYKFDISKFVRPLGAPSSLPVHTAVAVRWCVKFTFYSTINKSILFLLCFFQLKRDQLKLRECKWAYIRVPYIAFQYKITALVGSRFYTLSTYNTNKINMQIGNRLIERLSFCNICSIIKTPRSNLLCISQ